MQKKKIIVVCIVLLCALAMGALYFVLMPKAQAGEKSIVFTVVHGDESTKEFSLNTSAENLEDALEAENLVQGEHNEMGIYVTAVDGETADEALQQWWCFYKDGEMLMVGIDQQVIADGEKYEAVLTTGW